MKSEEIKVIFFNLGKIAAVSIVMLLLFSPQSASAQLADSPWPMYHNGPQHRSLSPYDTSHVEPTEKWRFDAGHGIETSPTIGPDGTIYFGVFKDYFIALNPDGTVKWKFKRKGEEFRSSAAIGKDGTIYFGATCDHTPLYNVMHDDKSEYGTPKLYALNPDGTKKWEFVTGGLYSGTYAAPLIGNDGTIYLGSGETQMKPGTKGGGRLWAVNPDGTGKWDFYTGVAFYTAPAMSKDGKTIYAPCANNNIYALDLNGKEKWRFTTKGYCDGSATIGKDGTIYAGSVDKNLYAITPEGKEKWHFAVQDIAEATPSIGPDGTIYMGTIDQGKDHNLYALTPEGKEKWRFDAGNGVYATPAIGAEGTLYFGSYSGKLHAVSPDGNEKWHFQANGGIVASPSIGRDGTIYFGSWDNHLYAIGGGSPTEKDSKDIKDKDKTTEEEIPIPRVIGIIGVLLIALGISIFSTLKK
ncbi:PQQ-binding-like beta-propeller repeat protein [Patescibacteria group bacterium]